MRVCFIGGRSRAKTRAPVSSNVRDMKMIKKLFIILIAFYMCGCIANWHNYNVRVYNVGSKQLNDVELESNKGFWHSPGVLVPDAWKTYIGPIKFTASALYTFSWQSSNGEIIQKKIDLRTEVPKDFTGTLIFKIDDNNELTYETK